jgi:hypothetical protein
MNSLRANMGSVLRTCQAYCLPEGCLSSLFIGLWRRFSIFRMDGHMRQPSLLRWNSPMLYQESQWLSNGLPGIRIPREKNSHRYD